MNRGPAGRPGDRPLRQASGPIARLASLAVRLPGCLPPGPIYIYIYIYIEREREIFIIILDVMYPLYTKT